MYIILWRYDRQTPALCPAAANFLINGRKNILISLQRVNQDGVKIDRLSLAALCSGCWNDRFHGKQKGLTFQWYIAECSNTGSVIDPLMIKPIFLSKSTKSFRSLKLFSIWQTLFWKIIIIIIIIIVGDLQLCALTDQCANCLVNLKYMYMYKNEKLYSL